MPPPPLNGYVGVAVMPTDDVLRVTVYTDGACSPNPGLGGWGAILLYDGRDPQELIGWESGITTNNRMELRAALEALQTLSGPHQVQLFTDSKYLRNGITQWLSNWERRNWQTKENTAVKNQDLWRQLAKQNQRHRITWRWVKGHAGNRWNERVNHLAASAVPIQEMPLDDDRAIHIFAAASYLSSERKGGWGVLLRHQNKVRVLSDALEDTSGNRMHLMAAIAGLNVIRLRLPIHIYTVSNYLKDGATVWVEKWSKNKWLTREGKPVRHRDLWQKLDRLTGDYSITWHVIKKKDMPDCMIEAKQLAREAVHSG